MATDTTPLYPLSPEDDKRVQEEVEKRFEEKNSRWVKYIIGCFFLMLVSGILLGYAFTSISITSLKTRPCDDSMSIYVYLCSNAWFIAPVTVCDPLLKHIARTCFNVTI